MNCSLCDNGVCGGTGPGATNWACTCATPVRFSRLKYMARSPAHYQSALAGSMEGAEREESVAMRLGSAVDAAIFQHREVLCWDGVRRGKEWLAFREAAGRDAIILNAREQGAAAGMEAALRAHDGALELLTDGDSQRTLTWEHDGRACAGTPDIYNLLRVVDLKTSRTSEPRQFMRHAAQMGYHAQLAWYRYGIAQQQNPVDTNGVLPRPREACLVVVESSPPWPVVVYKATERLLEQGDALWKRWFERLLECEQKQEWPGYAAAEVTWDVDAHSMPVADPEWMME